ncbi:glycosyltransferase family 4 protein [Falsibacillus pallidus]|uniref:Glycosyltransferase involved in cell wall biosynthesis n=1 Tax=Falsibacillus pallidus TaxID=493781 RepID=A0A370GJI0_9BACI|nr:glycosyltransferase family 4 protein [Falsibacillus pallidus]RDI43958.1 glycosyltransferase involved in cell wall biosynthesis [Falsibacillus pallidus]
MKAESEVSIIFFKQTDDNFLSINISDKREYAGSLAASYLMTLQEIEKSEMQSIFLVINPKDLQLFEEEDFRKNAEEWMLRSFKETSHCSKHEMGEIYSQWIHHKRNIVEAIKSFIDSGKAIGVPTAIKKIPFTHYKSRISIQEQIRQSKSLWKEFFHYEPNGFWLPKCAFMPGIEQQLIENDIQYVFAGKMGIQMAEPKRDSQPSIIQTPQGLKIIGIKENQKISNEHTELFQLDYTGPFSEMMLKETEWPIGVPGFTYLGMESGTAILSDEELLDLMKIHRSEKEAAWHDSKQVDGQPDSFTALLLSWEYPPNIVGGLSKHVAELAAGMSNKGIKVIILTAGSRGLPEFENIDGLHIYRVCPIHENEPEFIDWVAGLNIEMIQTACKIIKEESVQVIHAHDWLVSSAAGYLKKHFRLPLVTTIHSTENGRNNGIYNEIQSFIHEKEKELIHLSDEVIVCSDYMKAEVREQFDLLESHMIPNGIKISSLKTVPQGTCGLESWINGRKLVFSIGRMVGEKGFQTVIEAAEKMADERSTICFILAGKGPLLAHYRQMGANRGLEDFVQFPGFISEEEKNRLFQMASVSVFPSLYEPFGIVALEAMAAKSPLIVTNTGGLKGIVQNGVSGQLVEPDDSKELAAAITEVIQSPAFAKKLAENAYKMAESLFGWDRICNQTIDVYKDLWLKLRVQDPVQVK